MKGKNYELGQVITSPKIFKQMTSRSSKYDPNDSIFKQPSVDNSDPTFMTYVNCSSRKKPTTISVHDGSRAKNSSDNSLYRRHAFNKESTYDELN